MSIVKDRMCDGCAKVIVRNDDEWWALTPPGWDGEDRRFDFCNTKCLKKWVLGGAV
jgi:hypothetical protein